MSKEILQIKGNTSMDFVKFLVFLSLVLSLEPLIQEKEYSEKKGMKMMKIILKMMTKLILLEKIQHGI